MNGRCSGHAFTLCRTGALLQQEPHSLDGLVHHFMGRSQSGKGVEVMREALVVIQLASNAAFSESVIQKFPVIPKAILFGRDYIAGWKFTQILGE